MNILLFIDTLNTGGAQRQLVTLAVGLKEKGWNPIIVTYFKGENDFEHILGQKNIRHFTVERGNVLGLSLVYRLNKIVKREKVKIILAYQYKPSFYSLLYKFFFRGKVKIIVSERTFEAAVPFFDKKITRRFYPLASAIVPNSYHQGTALRQMNKIWKNKVKVICNGIDKSFFKESSEPTERDNSLELIGVGRVVPVKDIETIIEAINYLVKEKKNVRFSWIGESFGDEFPQMKAYREKCNALIQQYGIGSHWNWIPKTNDIKHKYLKSDALIHVSKGEGFPNVICEAMANSLPVFASKVGDHEKIIIDKNNGFLIEPGNAEDLAQKIKIFVSLTEGQKEDIGQKALETARDHFAVNKMVANYVDLIKQVHV